MIFKKLSRSFVVCIVLIFTVSLVALSYFRFVDEMPKEFPPTFVINLDKRQDRMNEIKTEFKHWPVSIERISAIKLSPGWKGCFASHLKCIQIAKDRNYPWVVILEDDCILTPNAIHRFHELLPFLWNNRRRWDMFNGGVTYLKQHTQISRKPSIHEVYGYAANFYMVHQAAYNRILNGCPKNPEHYKDPVDVYYTDTFRIWTTTPYLAKQRPGESDIGEKMVKDYTGLFDVAERTLLESEQHDL